MYDIFFISYDEPNAAENFERLVERFPHARRVHGVKGIANAHFEAARRANTKWFFVVDADAEVDEDFDFSYQPPDHDAKYVHIWPAYNPATGLVYGYGGVKLFNKAMFTESVRTAVDFSTTLAHGIKLMPDLSCTTRFNSDPLRAFRGAFRETSKLYFASLHATNAAERADALNRLAAWLEPVTRCDNRVHVAAGARAALRHAVKSKAEDIQFINDTALVEKYLKRRYPYFDTKFSVDLPEDHPMKREFFFVNRIASALYDPFVLQRLPITELRDAMSDGQVLSKLWLVEELPKAAFASKLKLNDPPRVAILGGWIGTLALMLNVYELGLDITSIDLDARANRIAETLNYDFKFSTRTEDMYEVNYADYDIIINTSSEHIPDIPRWRALLPPGKILAVQNNNMTGIEDHVSTVTDSGELHQQLNLKKVLYEGTRRFPHFSRFMLIGVT